MAKGKSYAPVVINAQKFLLPRMEFFVADKATGEGFYIRELGGKALLECKEQIDEMRKEAGDDATLSPSQSISLMVFFVMKSACNTDGHPIFTEDDAILLAEKSPAMLQEIADKAMQMAGMDSSAVTEATKTLPNDPAFSSTIN